MPDGRYERCGRRENTLMHMYLVCGAPLRHEDHGWVPRARVELGAVGPDLSEHVAGKLHDRNLHPQADAQVGDLRGGHEPSVDVCRSKFQSDALYNQPLREPFTCATVWTILPYWILHRPLTRDLGVLPAYVDMLTLPPTGPSPPLTLWALISIHPLTPSPCGSWHTRQQGSCPPHRDCRIPPGPGCHPPP